MTDTEKTLEQRVLELETKPRRLDLEVLAELMLLRRRTATLHSLIGSLGKWAKVENVTSDELRVDVNKLYEAYYRVFPERLEEEFAASKARSEESEASAAAKE